LLLWRNYKANKSFAMLNSWKVQLPDCGNWIWSRWWEIMSGGCLSAWKRCIVFICSHILRNVHQVFSYCIWTVEFILWEAHGTFPILIVAGKKPLCDHELLVWWWQYWSLKGFCKCEMDILFWSVSRHTKQSEWLTLSYHQTCNKDPNFGDENNCKSVSAERSRERERERELVSPQQCKGFWTQDFVSKFSHEGLTCRAVIRQISVC
jgi:hypothetical protein